MKTSCSSIFFLSIPLFLLAQSSTAESPAYWPPVDSELSASEIFEKVIRYYDPERVWDQFEGSMHMYTIGNGTTGEEDLSIDNTNSFYRSIKYLNDSTFVKGLTEGKLFFQVNGQERTETAVPERLQQNPYSLSEQSVRTMAEHHKFHFSIPLALRAAGAEPLPEVKEKSLFGTDCLAIQFSDLPDHYEQGVYNGQITLYVNPNDNYKLHAAHFDNGFWTNQEGVLNVFSGEIEINGLIIPQQRLYFDAANHNYRFVDAFSTKTRMDEIKNGPHRRLLYMSFKEGTSAEDIRYVKDTFQGMVDKIAGMDKAIWMRSPDDDSEYEYSLLLEFADTAALKAYEEHPDHQAVAEKGGTIVAKLLGHTYQDR